jgi:hypothetical protein
MILGERNKGEADVGRITAKERTCGWEGAEWTPRNVAAGGRGPQELVAHTAADLLRWGGPAGQHTPHVKRPDPYPATSYSWAPPPALTRHHVPHHQPPSDIFCSNLFPDLYLILPIRVCLKAVDTDEQLCVHMSSQILKLCHAFLCDCTTFKQFYTPTVYIFGFGRCACVDFIQQSWRAQSSSEFETCTFLFKCRQNEIKKIWHAT